MPSEAPLHPTQPEKPHHYTYLKEFRTQQCPLFLQHKCTQHRPFTCFHWHFLNQRRRRPVRKRDGTFNYSPDSYCTKYDETTGICPDGDECSQLHRTAGDTERRYHLRYYKTGNCVHETDAKGHCVKNGPHCAFAHGTHDLRQAVYDNQELGGTGNITEKLGPLESSAATQLEKDRQVNEDPKWNDTNYVLTNYKTEQCKRPPRLCRQGYACPSYHNSRDRRRSPKKHKYRSTPCPNVKHGDDWGDPAQCDTGDSCQYCHTRTEQQFHPEIYKSTKCNDMVQTGYCPRGPFCAFAHVEQEMTTQRELSTSAENSLAAFVTNALPQTVRMENGKDNDTSKMNGNGTHDLDRHRNNSGNDKASTLADLTQNGQVGWPSFQVGSAPARDAQLTCMPEPIGRHRSASGGTAMHREHQNHQQHLSNLMLDVFSQAYQRAPGSEREHRDDSAHQLRAALLAIEEDPSLDAREKNKRRNNLLILMQAGMPGLSMNNSLASTMSPHAPSFYPAGDTVESVIGNALDDDLNLGELNLSSIERDLAKEQDNDANSVCSSYSTGFGNNTSYFGPSSVPVTIPGGGMQDNQLSSMSGSPVSASPVSSQPGTLTPLFTQLQNHHSHTAQQRQEQQLQEAAMAFLSQPNPGKYSAPGYTDNSIYNTCNNSMSPRRDSISQSPLLTGSFSSMNGFGEVQRLTSELATNKAKMVQWEEGITQARNACEAWKKEAEESIRKVKIAEDDRVQAIKQRDEAVNQVAKLTSELDRMRGGPFLHCLQRVGELDNLPNNVIKQMQQQLRIDLETLDKVMFSHPGVVCVVCKEAVQMMASTPCKHYVMCEHCAGKQHTCPICHVPLRRTSSSTMPSM